MLGMLLSLKSIATKLPKQTDFFKIFEQFGTHQIIITDFSSIFLAKDLGATSSPTISEPNPPNPSTSGGRLWRHWETHCGGDHQAVFCVYRKEAGCFSLKIWNLISIIINLSYTSYKSRFFCCRCWLFVTKTLSKQRMSKPFQWPGSGFFKREST